MDGKAEANNHLEHISKAMNMFRDRAIQVLVYLLFCLTRTIIVTFQKFSWAVAGVERIRRDAARGLQFKQSAHVQEIFWKRKFVEHSLADPSYFITTHKGFRQPNCIFKPNVSLYCMTRKEAVFVEVEESESVYKCKYSNCLYQNQYHLAKNIITMPLASFHKIASDVGNPRVPVTWMSSTARSGATLLSQMMFRIPGMLVLSEPDALTTLGFLYRKKLLQTSEYQQLVASCVKLLCKPDDRYCAVFIRARPCTTSLLEDIVKMFPRFRYLFMYRNSVKSLVSNLSQFQHDAAPQALRFIMDSSLLSTLFPFVRSYFYYYHVFLNEKKVHGLEAKKLDTVGIITAAWAANVCQCSDLRYKGYNIGSILYEDFMINPRRALSGLLSLLDIRREHLSQAAEALTTEATRGNIYDITVDVRRILTCENRQEADAVLKAYGLSKLGERFEIPGLLKLE